MNVCAKCGMYRADKIIDPVEPAAICPECGHRYPFLRLPLFVVGGPSGVGKTTVLERLERLPGREDRAYIPLDSDILWRAEFNRPQDNYRDFFETWLRMAKHIHQSGRPVMLFGAGCGVPGNIEPCVERRYFSQVHYLALVCDDAELRKRLLARPAWRNAGSEEFIAAQLAFNHWLKAEGPLQQPPVALLDTTSATVDETAEAVLAWGQQQG